MIERYIEAENRLYDEIFDRASDLNRQAILGWRKRFRAMFEEIAVIYPPRDTVDMAALGDMVPGVVEGGLVLQRALRHRDAPAQQVMLLRSYIKLLFSPRPV